ncbi:MoaD/ThiS family protein [archaeon]|nr:MAG: MoaD/ThiS family protein [archaeon]
MALVRFYADLRGRAREKEARIDAESIGALIDRLFYTHRDVYEAILEEGELRPYVRIFVNGRDITFLSGRGTPIGPDDEVALFPPVAGG